MGTREKRLRSEDRALLLQRELARLRAAQQQRRADDRVGKQTWAAFAEPVEAPRDLVWEARAQAFDEVIRAALATPDPGVLAVPEHAATMVAVTQRRAATLYRRALDEAGPDAHGAEVDAALASVGGAALPDDLRAQLEGALGVSLARVRIHTDALAADAARAVRAHAFTVGEDIFFAAGAYAPDSHAGRALLAHELAHVVQGWQGRTDTHGAGGVSHAGDPLEREADAVAERVVARIETSSTAAQAVARAPAPPIAAPARQLLRKGNPTDELPTTAGGKRLDRLLATGDSFVPELRTLIERRSWSDVDDKVRTLLDQPAAPSVTDALSTVASSDGASIDNALSDATRKATVLRAFHTDLAAILVEQILVGKIVVATLRTEAEKIGRTYVRFANDERAGRLGTVHPTGAANQQHVWDFERRATQFHDFALTKLGANTDRARDVLAGLAADGDAFDTGDEDAALQGGRALVAQLLETNDLGGLHDLYHTVLDDVRGRANSNASALAHLLDADLDLLVIGPIRAALAAKPDQKAKQIAWLARECGDFLARLDPSNVASLVRAHLGKLDGTFVVVYGGGNAIPLPADVRDQLERADREAASDHAATTAPPVKAPAPTTPAKTPTRTATSKPLDLAELGAWLRSFFTNRKAFDAKHLDLGSAANDAAAHTAAAQVLGLLVRHIDSARKRDAAIAKQRGGQSTEMPDYVGVFSLDRLFYTQLDQLLNGHPIDVAGLDERLTPQIIEHFGALTHYQTALAGALTVVAKSKSTPGGRHVAERYADSFALDAQHLAGLARDPKQLPGWTADSKALERADTLVVETQRNEEILGRADVELTAQRTARIEEEVYARATRIVTDLWAKRDAAARESKLTPDEVWKAIKPLLSTIDKPGDEAIARGFIDQIVDDANANRLENLQVKATSALLDQSDTLLTEQQIARVRALQADLRDPETAAPAAGDMMDKLLELARSESQNLITIYTMADVALAAGAGDWGDHMRAANLLKIAFSRGAVTLHSAYAYLKAHEYELQSEITQAIDYEKAQLGPISKVFYDGTSKELFHGIQTSKWGAQGSVRNAFDVLDRSHGPKGALGMLMAVEEAGGGVKRRGKIADIADRLADKGGSQGYATAKFVYAYALDAIDLLDKSVRDEIEKDNKKAGKSTTLASRDSAVSSFDKGIHPKTKQPLAPEERQWWNKYKKITGEDNIILPGKEGWAKLGDFVKQLVTMLALAWVTGGLAAGAAEMASLSAAGEFLVEVGLFTEAMRFSEEMKSGSSSEHGFAHDFLVNAAMMGMPKLVVKGFGRLFTTPTTLLGKVAFKAGEFGAEYAAASTINLIDLALTKGIDGISAEDLKDAVWSNFAFIAAFKGVAVLGAAATSTVDRALGNGPTAEVRALNQKLKELDKQLQKELVGSAKLKDSAARRDALARQAKLLESKAKVLEATNLPKAHDLAASYRTGLDAYHADIARADAMISIGAEPIAGTPDFTYSGGPGAEARLAEHLAQSGTAVTVTEGLGGKIYELQAGGGKVRFTPREMLAEGAGSAKSLYAKSPRIEKATLDKPADVMKVINGSPARSHLIPDGAGAAFQIAGQSGARAFVTIKPVDAHSIKSVGHDAGPAVMRPTFDKATGMFRFEIEVLRDTPNDQIVRSVNHEITEIEQHLDRAVEEAGGDPKKLADKFKTQKDVDALMREEGVASATKKGSKSKDVSAHDVGVMNGDVHTLGLQLEELVHAKRDPKLSPKEREVIDARLELLRKDMSKVWTSLGLPEDKVALDKRLEAFEQAGVHLSPEARSQLQIMRAGKAELAGVGRTIGVIEIKIAFVELQKANSKLLEGATYLDLMEYYESAIAQKAEVEMSKVMDKTGDVAAARRRGLEIIREQAGGTSIASWRGRAFEGLGIEEWNKDPDRVADRGRAYAVEPNNFPTFDAVCVKGAEGPMSFETEDGRLKIKDKNGKRIYAEYEHRKPYLAPGVEIWKASMKAKTHADPHEMGKALGTPDDPSGHGMIVTPEYMVDLKATIAEGKKLSREAQRAADRGEGKQRDADEAAARVAELEWFATKIEVSKTWSIARIDAMLEAVKDAGIDTKNLRANLPKVKK